MEKDGELRLYEIAYLVKADDEQAASDRAALISEAIEKGQGIVASQTQISRKTLSYPVSGEREGWWGSLKFMVKPENISVIKEKIKSDEKVLRFLLFKTRGAETREKPQRKRRIKPTPEEKASIAEIDKKLEEILGT